MIEEQIRKEAPQRCCWPGQVGRRGHGSPGAECPPLPATSCDAQRRPAPCGHLGLGSAIAAALQRPLWPLPSFVMRPLHPLLSAKTRDTTDQTRRRRGDRTEQSFQEGRARLG